MASFDPYDWTAHYFGEMSRTDTNELLGTYPDGTFLVRDSSTLAGEYVLSVKEGNKTSHYLISQVTEEEAKTAGEARYKIGEQFFPDIASLLNFYKVHYLESTPLLLPAPKQLQTLIAKYDFHPQEPTDLGFKKGEKLWMVHKSDDDWWMAKNELGTTGQVPANYLEIVSNAERHSGGSTNRLSSESSGSSSNRDSGTVSESPPEMVAPPFVASPSPPPEAKNHHHIPSKFPAWAVVTKDRVPNLYDKTALKLKVGDRILVTKTNPSGTWEGALNGKSGLFPFTYVEFLEEEKTPSEVS